ncbi:hypothetical protein I316_06125 [Kwoniella heveanensis BCC8398]|uniref:Uncharacterized protein n=1 Tax=Kwoniella heveanensis BCC8398 TaxID=1296120 RepID=A0A1B9GMI8_9TREE|nr:hypothetical protein I316_06125 [Kwoniella heveanensis BCC8398]
MASRLLSSATGRRSGVQAFRARPIRYLSSQSAPSPKICSVPFKIRPEDAAQRMLINGLLASASLPSMILAGALRLFGPSVIPFAKEFGVGSNVRMKDMKAVLYPIWRVDSIIEGKVKLQGSSSRVEPSIWVSTREGYVPGNPFAPLSYLSFAILPLPDDLPSYNLAEDLTQLGDGYEIVPVPFTVSPLGLEKKIRRTIGSNTRWEGVIIDEKRFEEIMLAAYPIMFPIYIAEFEHDLGDEGTRSFNVIMDAHDEDPANCRVSWPPPPQLVENGRFDKNYFVNPAPFLPMANLLLYPSVAPHQVTGPNTVKLVEAYREWMSPAPDKDDIQSIAPSPMVSVQEQGLEGKEGPGGQREIDWDDVRIQSWSGKERMENGDWIEQALKTQKGVETLETMTYVASKAQHPENIKGLVINTKGLTPKFERKSLFDMEDQLRADLDRMKDELRELKPAWLVEYDRARGKSVEDGPKTG